MILVGGQAQVGIQHAPPVLSLSIADDHPQRAVFSGRHHEIAVNPVREIKHAGLHGQPLIAAQLIRSFRRGGKEIGKPLVQHIPRFIVIRAAGKQIMRACQHRIADFQLERLRGRGIVRGDYMKADEMIECFRRSGNAQTDANQNQ